MVAAAFAADNAPSAPAPAAPAAQAAPAPATPPADNLVARPAAPPAAQPAQQPAPLTLDTVAQVVNNQGQVLQTLIQGVATRQDTSALSVEVIQLRQRVAQLEQVVSAMLQPAPKPAPSSAPKASPTPAPKK